MDIEELKTGKQRKNLITNDKGALTLTIFLLLAIIKRILRALDINPLPLDDNTVSTVITTVFALWAWWKNNDFTHAAKQGTELTKSLKNGASVQVVTASDAHHEFTQGPE